MSVPEPDGDEADNAGDTLDWEGEIPEWLSLDDDERVEWMGKLSYQSMLAGIAFGVLLIPVVGVGLLVIAMAVLTRKHTDYMVTNKSLYVKRGILSTNIESTGLGRIQNTEFSQSFIGKQLEYGSIDISTAGSGGADLQFRDIENPREVRDLVNRLSRSRSGRSSQSSDDEAPAESASDEMLRELLGELRATRESLENTERLLSEQRETAENPEQSEEAASESVRGNSE